MLMLLRRKEETVRKGALFQLFTSSGFLGLELAKEDVV